MYKGLCLLLFIFISLKLSKFLYFFSFPFRDDICIILKYSAFKELHFYEDCLNIDFNEIFKSELVCVK